MKNFIYLIIGVAIIGGIYFWSTGNITSKSITATSTPSVSTSTLESSNASTTPEASFSIDEVKSHKDATSCYSVINGNVYDLTNWINKHPGGPAKILLLCGRDGSSLFNTQHGTSGRPNSILATFKIGILK